MSHAAAFALDPSITFLNHGSFGACPRVVLEAQARLRDALEAEPVRFLARELEGRLDEARAALAAFVGADPADLAFVPNATSGVNTVLASLALSPGDELVVTSHGYAACRNAATAAAARRGARVVTAAVPFPIADAEAVVEAVVAALSPRTRLVLVDHVTSPTGLVFPVERLVAILDRRGIDVLIDGAHAPGMVPLDLDRLGAAYYTGNCHKWLCTPKGSALLHVRRDRQATVRPLVISHGAASERVDRSRFLLEHDWVGTVDPTPWLVIPDALRFLSGAVEGGLPALMARNRALALHARGVLTRALGVEPPAPEAMIGALAALPLPAGFPGGAPRSPAFQDGLAEHLYEAHRFELPVYRFGPLRVLRVAAQVYNREAQYDALAEVLARLALATRAAVDDAG